MGCVSSQDADAKERRENKAIDAAQRRAVAEKASKVELIILGKNKICTSAHACEVLN